MRTSRRWICPPYYSAGLLPLHAQTGNNSIDAGPSMTSLPGHFGFRACVSRMVQGALTNTASPLFGLLPNQAEDHPSE
jgi:hypothetical protein